MFLFFCLVWWVAYVARKSSATEWDRERSRKKNLRKGVSSRVSERNYLVKDKDPDDWKKWTEVEFTHENHGPRIPKNSMLQSFAWWQHRAEPGVLFPWSVIRHRSWQKYSEIVDDEHANVLTRNWPIRSSVWRSSTTVHTDPSVDPSITHSVQWQPLDEDLSV
jgi:hypothetical protein